MSFPLLFEAQLRANSPAKSSCAPALLEALQCFAGERIGGVAKEACQGTRKHRRCRGQGGEQRHAGAKFEIVRRGEDVVDRAGGSNDELSALDEARAEYRLLQVGFSFAEAAKPIVLRHGTMPEAAQLRKHEPHPVAVFAPCLELTSNLRKHRGLGVDEARQVEGVAPRSRMRLAYAAARDSAGAPSSRSAAVSSAPITMSRCRLRRTVSAVMDSIHRDELRYRCATDLSCASDLSTCP